MKKIIISQSSVARGHSFVAAVKRGGKHRDKSRYTRKVKHASYDQKRIVESNL